MPKILIVDDESSLRQIYGRFLREEGFETFEAWNGEQALLGFQGENIDVILLDIQMPVANGHVLVDALQHFHPDAKIIVASCYPLDVQKGLIKNAQEYFDKSEGCWGLLAKIKAVLSEDPDLCNPVNRK